MSDRWCPYCESKSGLNIFGASYRCAKTGEDIYSGSETYTNFCYAYESGYSNCPHFKPETTHTSGCYLTSACVEAMGLPDDCLELTTLRSFRDNWLSKLPKGKEEIAKYYFIAPLIVDAIQARNDSKMILRSIYNETVFQRQTRHRRQYNKRRPRYGDERLEEDREGEIISEGKHINSDCACHFSVLFSSNSDFGSPSLDIISLLAGCP